MSEGVDLSSLTSKLINPDPNDPYTFDGVSYAPARYMRVFRTEADVIEHLRQAKITRHKTDEDISRETGIDMQTILRITSEGKGRLATFMAVLDVLGVVPVHIPISIVQGD